MSCSVCRDRGPTSASVGGVSRPQHQQAPARCCPAGGEQGTIYRLEPGQVSATEMFAHEEGENTILTWALRGLGFLLMAVGLSLVFRPVATVADVVPFLGNLLSAGAGVFAG
jgi:Transmembrane protein 43